MKIFSNITIEQSTTRPIPRISPAIVSIFNVVPVRFITNSVTNMENGMDIPIMIVLLILRKNRNNMSIASTRPSKAELINSLIIFRVWMVLS